MNFTTYLHETPTVAKAMAGRHEMMKLEQNEGRPGALNNEVMDGSKFPLKVFLSCP